MKKHNWIQSVLSAEGDQSSKRLMAIYCILTGSAMAWVSTFTEFKTPDYMYQTLMYVGVTLFMGTIAESIFIQRQKSKPTPKQNATDTPPNEETV